MSEDLDKRAQKIGDRLNQDATQKPKKKESLKGRPSLTMYLPEGLHERLKTKFLELQLKANKQGKDLEKNRDFYPRVIEAGLNQVKDEEVLGE